MRKLFCELTFKEVYTNSMYLTFFPFSQMHAISYYTGDVGREGGVWRRLVLISLGAICFLKNSQGKDCLCYPDLIPEAEWENAASTGCPKEPESRRDRTPVFLFYLPPHPGLTICPLSLGVAVGFALGQGQPSHRFSNSEDTRVGKTLGVLNGCPADS